MTLTGRCACGRVDYIIKDEPMFTHVCHCTDCQRTTGSAFVVHLIVAEDDFEIAGNTRAITLPTGSGAGYDLHFCAECGTYLWVRYHYHKVRVIAVRGGTLDDVSKIKPQAHIFTRSMQAWMRLPEDVPSFAEACSRDEAWPAASVIKYNSLSPIDA
jgi:hypothetical protein